MDLKKFQAMGCSVQVPGKPLLITQEPPPEEDLGQLQSLRNSFTGIAVLLDPNNSWRAGVNLLWDL